MPLGKRQSFAELPTDSEPGEREVRFARDWFAPCVFTHWTLRERSKHVRTVDGMGGEAGVSVTVDDAVIRTNIK